jgi:uncharacterized protein (DUF486 family)
MSIFAHPVVPTALLLAASNLFMTFAWYGHLKHLNAKPWWIAALVSWGIAQLKILQEVITLAVFVPFAVLYMGTEVKMNYFYAALCLMGAVYFIFRS